MNFNCLPFLSTFCWSINCMSWMPLNYTTYFRRLSIVYAWGFLTFSFMESSILSIIYVFTFFLLFKLYKSSLKIILLISDHLIFLGSVDTGGYLVVTYFERWILVLAHFSDVFFWPRNCRCQAGILCHILDIFKGF